MKTTIMTSAIMGLLASVAVLAMTSAVYANNAIQPDQSGRMITIYPAQTDGMVTSQVKHLLNTDPVLKQYDIDVSTNKGLVRLDGRVYWPSEKELATTGAKQIRGVRAVSNIIRVAGVDDMTTP